MTAAPHLTESDLIDHLLGRDDLTVDDITGLPEDLRYELIDGRLVLTPVGLPIHQILATKTVNALDENCRGPFVANQEQALRASRRTELRPDAMLIRAEGAYRSPVWPADVLLVVEIISPSSRRSDRFDKMKRYADVGIPLYWIVDPLADRVTFSEFALAPDGAYQRRVHTDHRVELDEPWPITLDLPAWTEKRDWLRDLARPDGLV